MKLQIKRINERKYVITIMECIHYSSGYCDTAPAMETMINFYSGKTDSGILIPHDKEKPFIRGNEGICRMIFSMNFWN